MRLALGLCLGDRAETTGVEIPAGEQQEGSIACPQIQTLDACVCHVG